MTDVPKEWESWTDVLGQTYTTGDLVAVATISRKSPQLVICEVLRINRVDSKGEEIVDREWVQHPYPIEKQRMGGSFYMEQGEFVQIPSCTVRVQPLLDARGFWRSTTNGKFMMRGAQTSDELCRPVTYSIPKNIIRVPSGDFVPVLPEPVGHPDHVRVESPHPVAKCSCGWEMMLGVPKYQVRIFPEAVSWEWEAHVAGATVPAQGITAAVMMAHLPETQRRYAMFGTESMEDRIVRTK